MMWADAAAWLAMFVALGLLAGSIKPGLSLTRCWHRYVVAPLLHKQTPEDALSFLRADAVHGTLAFAGSVFVITGVAPVGWMIVALCTLGMFLDSLVDFDPIRQGINASRM